jgi:hypothetical protein
MLAWRQASEQAYKMVYLSYRLKQISKVTSLMHGQENSTILLTDVLITKSS